MITRRELFSSGALGAAVSLEEQTGVDQRLAEDIVSKLDAIVVQLTAANYGCSSGVCPVGGRLREAMVIFLRANQKFPDFVDVGSAVFLDIYDWHVRNQQPLSAGRSADGRYGLGYLFTRLVLRPDATPDFIGVPYDLRP